MKKMLILAVIILLLFVPFASANTFTALSNPGTLPTGNANNIAYSPDGNYLAVAHAQLGVSPFRSMIVYSVSGTTFTKLSDPAIMPPGSANGVSWNYDSSTLAVAHNGAPYISFYSKSGSGASATLTKMSNPADLPPADASDACWSPAGTYAVVAHGTSPFITIYERSGNTFTKHANPDTLPAGTGTDCSWIGTGDYLAISNVNTPFLRIYSVGTPDVLGPTQVTNLTATGGNENVLLEWTTGDRTSHIRIYSSLVTHSPCASPLHADYSLVANLSTPVTSYVHQPLTNGITRYYCVESYNLTLNRATFNSTEVNATPNAGAPVLSGRAWRANAELEWTTGNYLPVVNFYLYKGSSSATLALFQTLSGTVQEYDDPQSPGECDYYAIQSANNTAESGLSNVLEVCYRPPPAPLFGDSGAIWGGTRNPDGSISGGKAEIAQAAGVNTLAIGILWGLVLTLSIAIGGYMAGKVANAEWTGALVGSVVGVAVSTIVDFFPVWLVAFVIVFGVAGLLLLKRNRGGA